MNTRTTNLIKKNHRSHFRDSRRTTRALKSLNEMATMWPQYTQKQLDEAVEARTESILEWVEERYIHRDWGPETITYPSAWFSDLAEDIRTGVFDAPR